AVGRGGDAGGDVRASPLPLAPGRRPPAGSADVRRRAGRSARRGVGRLFKPAGPDCQSGLQKASTSSRPAPNAGQGDGLLGAGAGAGSGAGTGMVKSTTLVFPAATRTRRSCVTTRPPSLHTAVRLYW